MQPLHNDDQEGVGSRGQLSEVDAIGRLRREVEDLRQRLERRSTIEQVKGMLALTYGVDDDGAFAILVTVSQNTNVKLRDVADDVRSAIVDAVPCSARRCAHEAFLDVYDHLRQA